MKIGGHFISIHIALNQVRQINRKATFEKQKRV